jgi:hypothetical protein
MEFRLQAEYLVTKHVRLKAELHTYFVCFVIYLIEPANRPSRISIP